MISEPSKPKLSNLLDNEDIVNYYTSAIVFNAGRKDLDKFGGWAPGVIKKINKSFKISFLGCVPIHGSDCLSNMM